ncbi:MAG TPA: hypothetical protein VKE91_16910 [Blastocatellia bacterium]|nr:hypothetical protein [Blastocatellia bacterium]
MAQSDSSIPSRLLKAVVAKSFIEIALVCLVATLAAFTTFSPQLRGAIDFADRTRVSGWVYDPRAPEETLEAQLFIDGDPVMTKPAGETRIDLVQSGVTSNPNHGFSFDLTPINLAPGRHTTQVYALRQATGENKILLPIAKQPSVFEVSR